MLTSKSQEKIFVYTKKHTKGEVAPEITCTEVQLGLAKYFKDFEVRLVSTSKESTVTVVPKTNEAKKTLQKLGISVFLLPRLKFSFSVGQSLMFRIHISNTKTYSHFQDMFDEIASTMKLDILDPFPKDTVTVLHS